ncbi:MAG: CXXX repeat peptide maturase [Muribaculaceae bacterium]|nr:CXXX repeat peptide maturase [Muribaculaceae bacterium]
MLQYLVILLDDTSTSYCHYGVNKKERRLISLDHLRQGIRFGMVENLMIQFVYPDYTLPQEYLNVIDTIDHSNIKPLAALDNETDIVVIDGWECDATKLKDSVLVLRTNWKQFYENHSKLKGLLNVVQRLNVVITDLERMNDCDRENYKAVLASLGKEVEQLYVDGKSPQFNLLTDRMILTEMNNCNAGDTTITLAPNGKFYICPAFYYNDENDNVGNIENGLDIKNKQLYKLDHAPICRKCDAWQCRRCTWLNRKTTLEVNTPSHEQCVAAHLERNASRNLMLSLRSKGTFLPDKEEIKELTYLDPFEIATQWK